MQAFSDSHRTFDEKLDVYALLNVCTNDAVRLLKGLNVQIEQTSHTKS